MSLAKSQQSAGGVTQRAGPGGTPNLVASTPHHALSDLNVSEIINSDPDVIDASFSNLLSIMNETGDLLNSHILCNDDENTDPVCPNTTVPPVVVVAPNEPSSQATSSPVEDNDIACAEEEAPKSRPRQKRKPEEWKQNVKKRMREQGLEYTKKDGSINPAREMKETCKCKSKGKECALLTDEERKQIFKYVWSLTWSEKRNFAYGMIDQYPTKKKTTQQPMKNRQSTLHYCLKKDGRKIPVCSKMFMNTTALTSHFIRSLFERNGGEDETSTIVDPCCSRISTLNSRKRPENANYKRGEAKREFLNQFLDSLPKMPSHYCRKSSSKLYLERCFRSLVDVYDHYKLFCQEHGEQPFKITAFKEVFYSKNLSLFKPKKDRCNTCIGFETGNISHEEWKDHMQQKDEALAEKQKDKERAIESHKARDRRFAAFCMDLESVLLAPSTEASAMYFKTKLSVHNFTVYNMATGAVSCYVWNETEGGVTANEFASCIINHLRNMGHYEEITIFSDGCTYQNRNVFLSNAIQQYVNETGITVQHKYLVRGHTHMEVDNSHSLIERALKGKTINVPYDYVQIMVSARKNPSPFEVFYLTHEFFMDYSDVGPYKTIRPGRKKGDATVTDVHCYKYHPQTDSNKAPLQFKIRFNDELQDIPIPRDFSKNENKLPTRLYNGKLPIPLSKFKHLQELKSVIGKDYHPFYDQLLHK